MNAKEIKDVVESTSDFIDGQLLFLNKWWVDNTELSRLEVAWDAYRIHLKETDKSYNRELSVLFFEIKWELARIHHLPNMTKEKKENLEEDLVLKLVEKIGILWSHFWINRWEKRLVGSGNPEFKNEHGIINIWNGENCFFVPWCFLNLRKLLDLGVIEKWNVNINLWGWVNIQEAIWFVKTSWELGNMTFERFTKKSEIEKISISTWSNCSFAHWATFYPGRRNDIEISAWNGVFFWINSLVWSGSHIWENTTIWWNANLWNNVKLWNNVIIWTSSIIQDGVEIPDDCLIQNFMVISAWFEVIEFEDYKNNKNHYVGRKNFIIRLSPIEKEKKEQIDAINSNYNFVRDFNLHNVVPENKIFAAVEDVYNFLETEIWFQSTKTYEYEANEKRFDLILNNSGINGWKEKINWFRNIQRKSRLVLKAYPKNAERFLIQETPAIMRILQEEKKNVSTLTPESKKQLNMMIEWYLDRPNFDEETMKNYFFWNTYITGKFHFDGKCLFFNLKSRWDELQENETIQIIDSIILSGTIHGWGNKTIERTKILDTTIHWGVEYSNSSIWEYAKPSVLNSTKVENSKIWWHFTCNGAEIINTSIVGARTSIAWGSWKQKVIINHATLWEWSCINTWTHVKNATIPAWKMIGKYMNIDWEYIWVLQ